MLSSTFINVHTIDVEQILFEVVFNSYKTIILFILYINGIRNLDIDGLIIVTCADDTCLLFRGVSWDDVSTKATRESKIVVEFLKKSRLSINLNYVYKLYVKQYYG